MPRRMFTPPTTLPDDPATLQLILRAALAEIERLQLQLAGLRRNRFGRRSEQLDDATLQQGEEDLEQSVAEQQAGLDAVLPPADAPPRPDTHGTSGCWPRSPSRTHTPPARWCKAIPD